MAAKSGIIARAAEAAGAGATVDDVPGRSVVRSGCVIPARIGMCVDDAEAVTKGRLLLPANTVTLLSGSIRTCISAPTRLSLWARTRPVRRPVLETPTSALGALA